ncbi:MAG: dihydroxyacetone kinase subunit DhaL [Bacteroides sp.]|nr:dihydroxyacetone kinase subunit DhaL [Bacteroides sp.]
MSTFNNKEGALVVDRMISIIQENKQYLSDIDGAIADGDHGINMNKGFTMTREALEKDPGDLSHGLLTLAKVLMMRIGGSMGPLYGKTFKTMGKTLADHEEIDAELFGQALSGARESMAALSPAKVGDKTLVDVLYPAIDAFNASVTSGADFSTSLGAMKKAAEEGRDATEDMIAKLGRSSRLGERSRGVIDAGAASCALLLGVMADTINELL